MTHPQTATAVTTADPEPEIIMTAAVTAGDLARATAMLNKVIKKKQTVPALSMFHATGKGSSLILTDSDIDIQLTAHIEAGVIGVEGACLIPARLLDHIAGFTSPAEVLTITATTTRKGDNGQIRTFPVTVETPDSQFTLNGQPSGAWPTAPAGPSSVDFKVNIMAGDLLTLIEKVEFAISTEETRYYLNGIYLHDPYDNVAAEMPEDRRQLRGVATNGHQMAMFDIDGLSYPGKFPACIVPAKAVAILKQILAEEYADAPVTLQISEKSLSARVGMFLLQTKLIDGQYPDYQKVIAPSDKYPIIATITANIQDIYDAVKRVSLFKTVHGYKAVSLAAVDGGLGLRCKGFGEEAMTSLSATSTGEAPVIGFNAKYFRQILKTLEGDQVTIGITSDKGPMLITGDGSNRHAAVLMPCKDTSTEK